MLTTWSDAHPGIGQVPYNNIVLVALQFYEEWLGNGSWLTLMRERYAISADSPWRQLVRRPRELRSHIRKTAYGDVGQSRCEPMMGGVAARALLTFLSKRTGAVASIARLQDPANLVLKRQ